MLSTGSEQSPRNGRRSRHTSVWTPVLAVVALSAALALAAPPTASAIPGLVTVAQSTEHNSEPAKTVSVRCPGDVGDAMPVGGGAEIDDDGRRTVRLTSLLPHRVRIIVNYAGYYSASAEAPGLARFPWSLRVYAVCASDFALIDYQLRDAIVHNGASSTFDHAEAVCPSGTVAWGSGAQVIGLGATGQDQAPTGQLGLQLVRTSGPLDIARATARESASGYDGQWRLRSRAICAKRKTWISGPSGPRAEDRGLHADGLVSSSPVASNVCPDKFFTHGLGGGAGGGTTDAGPVWLRGLHPHAGLRGMTAALTSSTVGAVAQQTCAR